MAKTRTTRQQQVESIEELRSRLEEAEQTLEAIRTGHVDAITVEGKHGPQVFTLQGAETAYRMVVETMNEGAMTIGSDRTILYANPYLSRLLHQPAEKIVGMRLQGLIDPPERAAAEEFLRRTLSGASAHQDFTLLRATGDPVPVYLSSAPLSIGDGQLACIIVTDLTERKVTERLMAELNAELERKVESRTAQLLSQKAELENINAELHYSESRFRELADAMPQLVWTANAEGAPDYYNQRYTEFQGIKPPSAGREWQWTEAVHEEDVEQLLEAWDAALTTGEAFEAEHRLRHQDGGYEWYLTRAVPVRNGQGKVVKWYGTTTNINQTKLVQEKLRESEEKLQVLNENLEDLVVRRTEQVRALSKALTVAEQRERRRFSHVLHDDLQQMLLSGKMLLDVFATTPELKGEELADIERVREILMRAVETARSLALELNPPILKAEGLDAAVRWLARHMEDRYGLAIRTDISPEIAAVAENDRVLIIQLTRELLFNIIKHANTKKVEITGRRSGPNLEITVEDQGMGFDVDEVRRRDVARRGLGIFSIDERLALFGGELEIDSQPGRGTRATMVLPFTPKRGQG